MVKRRRRNINRNIGDISYFSSYLSHFCGEEATSEGGGTCEFTVKCAVVRDEPIDVQRLITNGVASCRQHRVILTASFRPASVGQRLLVSVIWIASF